MLLRAECALVFLSPIVQTYFLRGGGGWEGGGAELMAALMASPDCDCFLFAADKK
jgi:hypothetical protein